MDVVNAAPETIDIDSVFNFSTENTAMASWWKTPQTQFIGTSKYQSKIPDIAKWLDGTLILSPKAFRYLGELLTPLGEFLPIEISNDTYLLFNCLVFGTEDESQCEKNAFDQVEKIIFLDNENSYPVFKSKFEGGFSLFCNTLFRETITSFELDGIEFDENLIEVFNTN
jgi:hypothetical protein